MTIRYGRKDCSHELRYRSDGWEEECVPAICKECGAFGCGCDSSTPNELFFKDAYKSDANPNGKWINPYVQREKEAEEKGLAGKLKE